MHTLSVLLAQALLNNMRLLRVQVAILLFPNVLFDAIKVVHLMPVRIEYFLLRVALVQLSTENNILRMSANLREALFQFYLELVLFYALLNLACATLQYFFGTLFNPRLTIQTILSHVVAEFLWKDLREMSACRVSYECIHTFGNNGVHHGSPQKDRVFADVLTGCNFSHQMTKESRHFITVIQVYDVSHLVLIV